MHHVQKQLITNFTWYLDPDEGLRAAQAANKMEFRDFLAQLHLGLAKAAFSRGQFADARQRFEAIVSRYSKTDAAPEALYWSAVSAYKATGDAKHLKQGGQKLKEKYPQTEWAKKGSVWLG